MLAQSSGTIDDAEAALADAVLVKRVMPDTLRCYSLAADSQVCAAAAYRRAGRMDQWDEHLAAAGREAEALAQFPNNQEALLVRAYVAAVRDGLAGELNLLDELPPLAEVNEELWTGLTRSDEPVHSRPG